MARGMAGMHTNDGLSKDRLHPEHQKKINEEIKNSLARAGIRRSFHDRSLVGLPEGKMLLDWIKQDKAEVQGGRGWTVLGEGTLAYETFVLLARGLHLSGLACRVIHMAKLVGTLDAGRLDLIAEWSDAACLFVSHAYDARQAEARPYSGWQMRLAEEYLGERLDDNRAVFLHGYPEIERDRTWWSPDFLQRVAQVNRKLVID